MLDDIAISYKVPHGASPIKFIEIVKDCISIYTDQELYQRYLTEAAKTVKAKNDAAKTVKVKNDDDGIIKCKGNDLKNIYKTGNIKRHLIWHVNDKIATIPHSHYTASDKSNIKQESIRCVLDPYKYFGSTINITMVSEQDINAIIKEYEKQNLAMKQNAKKLGQESAKSFLFLVLINFILDFSGRYLMPIMLYHSPDEIFKHKDILLKLGRVIQPIFIIINQILDYDILLSLLLISVSGMMAQYAGIKWLPHEFFRFINIARLLLTSEIDENLAKEAGFDVAVILGSTSAKALGGLLSNCLIRQLPKLKSEPLENSGKNINSPEEIILNKGGNQNNNDNIGLRQRK